MSATAMTAAITPKLYASANNGFINPTGRPNFPSGVTDHSSPLMFVPPQPRLRPAASAIAIARGYPPYRKNLVAMRSLVIRLSETINS